MSAGRIARLSSTEIPFILMAIVASACTGVIFPAYAMILSEVVSALYQPDQGDAVLWCVFFAALGAWAFVWNVVKMGSFTVAGERLTARLRASLFAAILRQDIGFFDRKEHESGALCTRLSGDTEKVHTLFGPLIATQVESVFTLGAGLGIAIWASPILTAVCLAAVPFMVVAGYLNMKYVKGFAQVSTKKYAEAGQIASESIMNIRVVQAYGLERVVQERYSQMLAPPEKEGIKAGALGGFFFGFGQFITQCTFALTFWVGGQLVKNGDLELVGVMKCAMAIMFSAMGMGQVQSFQTKISEARASTAKVFAILDRRPPIDINSEDGSRDIPKEVSIRFDNVSFAYPNRDTAVLRKFSFTARAGTQTAIIGDTGCGKSTVLALLQRFYDPLSGLILIGDRDIRDYHIRSWRDAIGIVSQEPVLFDDTVMENIRYGKPGATDEEVREAARIAQIHDVIMQLPDQYATILGERGSQLSGGQKQRVAIARAVIRRPRVLLLDEATSALDSKSEIEVRAALEHIIATLRMTVIVIAHRLTTIEGVDTIIVVKAGKVVESGSHAELLATGGEYSKRYRQYHSS